MEIDVQEVVDRVVHVVVHVIVVPGRSKLASSYRDTALTIDGRATAGRMTACQRSGGDMSEQAQARARTAEDKHHLHQATHHRVR